MVVVEILLSSQMARLIAKAKWSMRIRRSAVTTKQIYRTRRKNSFYKADVLHRIFSRTLSISNAHRGRPLLSALARTVDVRSIGLLDYRPGNALHESTSLLLLPLILLIPVVLFPSPSFSFPLYRVDRVSSTMHNAIIYEQRVRKLDITQRSTHAARGPLDRRISFDFLIDTLISHS